MDYMFFECSLLSLDLSMFDIPLVNNMKYMFYHCASLISIKFPSFNKIIIENMGYMFLIVRLNIIRFIYV